MFGKNGVIYGNPLLIEECQQSLIKHHLLEENVLKQNLERIDSLIPWFWSRESIDAALNSLKWFRITKSSYYPEFNTSNSTLYLNVEKAASSTIMFLLERQSHYTFQRRYIKANDKLSAKCGFSFI